MLFPRVSLTSFFFCYLLSFAVNAQNLQDKIDAFVEHPGLETASIGIDVMDLETGQSVANFNANRALIPASTQKLITTAAALNILGENATFETTIAIDGLIENGVLDGDIFIVGGGDPSLGSPRMDGVKSADELLQEWVEAIQKTGVREIKGTIIADDSYYGTDGVAPNWPWSDIGNYYGSGTYGLNWHENLYYLDFLQRAREGDTPSVIRTRPEIPGLTLRNELRTGRRGSGDNAYIYGAPFNYDNYIRGTIPPGSGRFTIKGAIPDPPLLLAQQLAEKLKQAGLKIVLPPSSSRLLNKTYSGTGKVVARHSSPSITKLAERTNYKSVNLFAETLLREINKSRGANRTEGGSTMFLIDYLGDELGLNVSGVQLEDGSGLSTRNFFSPAFMTAFLRSQANNATFRSSIPLAGKTGSMQNRLKNTAAAGRLYAKSGSVNAVRCYAGYAFPANGRKLAFSFMVNNYTLSGREVNRLLLDLMRTLCDK